MTDCSKLLMEFIEYDKLNIVDWYYRDGFLGDVELDMPLLKLRFKLWLKKKMANKRLSEVL
jgi:hypothetical protein